MRMEIRVGRRTSSSSIPRLLQRSFVTPFGGVFAYSAGGSIESIATAFVSANEALPIHERANSLAVLSSDAVLLWAFDTEREGPDEVQALWLSCASSHAKPFWLSSETNSFAAFYWILWDAVQNYRLPRFSAFAYLFGLEFESRFWRE